MEKNNKSILKKLERYLSIKNRSMFTKSKSWHQVAPTGCFSVYVGPERQRFVVKTEFANHPLFKILLEDAELEYGFSSEGPLVLPCDVNLFHKVLAEMDQFNDDHPPPSFGGYGGCSPFNTARRLARGYSSYGLLTPPRMLKINHF